MKKIIKMLILSIAMLFPMLVLAKGNVSVSRTNISLTKGQNANFVITANNAVGRVDISSSNNNIASVSSDKIWVENNRTTITVKGNAVGSTTIKVKITDVTTFDDENLSGTTYTINVNVKEPVILANNNKLANIEVVGFNLEKVDDHNYVLQVENNIEKVVIKASAEDYRAKVSGVGEKNLTNGENIFIIVITAESGVQNTINVKINKKDGYYLEDLENALATNNSVIIRENDMITKDDLTKIKKSEKTISLNFYNQDKQLIYSYIVDGKQLNTLNDILTTISLTTNLKEEIDKSANYAFGLYPTLKFEGDIPKGVTIKLYVGNMYQENNELNLYLYNLDNKKLELVEEKLVPLDGYVNLPIKKGANYFLTRSNILTSQSNHSVVGNNHNSFNIIIPIILSIALIVMIILYIFKGKTKSNKIVYNNYKE